MACPFLENPIDLGARIVRGALRRARVFRDRTDPLSFLDDHLYESYWFSREGLVYICQLLEPYVARDTRRSCALTVPQSVCITLCFYASGTYLYTVGDAERFTKSTVCVAIQRVSAALTELLDGFVAFPGHLPIQEIKEGFYTIAGFPRVIGVMDCTHVRITGPLGENEGDYVNCRSYHSLNIQMTCDHNCLIMSLDAKWPSSVHDSWIFRESRLCRTLEQGLRHGVLVGDRGYPCVPYLMTPYPDPGEGPQTQFTVALSRTRVKIEMTFGILKARFNCLRNLRVTPRRACRIITSCVVLHNIATIRLERVSPADPLPPDVVDPITLDHPTGRAVRRAIKEQSFI